MGFLFVFYDTRTQLTTIYEFQGLHSVDVLLSALEGRQRTLGFINERAMASDHDSSWAEVRHFIGRLRSYGSAVTIFLEARLAWAELFRNINILFIPSSTPLGNPFPPRGGTSPPAVYYGRKDDATGKRK